MSFIPTILNTNKTTLKKQTHQQIIPQNRWIIQKQIIGNVKVTVTDSNGIELTEQLNNIMSGDYVVTHQDNIIIIDFPSNYSGRCELILIDTILDVTIPESLDLYFKSSDVLLLLPYNTNTIDIEYKNSTLNTYTSTIFKINTPYNILIHNMSFSIYNINTSSFELAQNDIISIIKINNYNININNNFILTNTIQEIMNGELNVNKFLDIFVEKTNFYIENVNLKPFIILQ